MNHESSSVRDPDVHITMNGEQAAWCSNNGPNPIMIHKVTILLQLADAASYQISKKILIL